MVEPVRFPDIGYRGWGEPCAPSATFGPRADAGRDSRRARRARSTKSARIGNMRPVATDDIFIDGEGMMHMFRFKDNHVDYVEPLGPHGALRAAEGSQAHAVRAVSESLYQRSECCRCSHGHARNTTAMFHAGRLYALKEDDLPYRIDPETLETLGRDNFDGKR